MFVKIKKTAVVLTIALVAVVTAILPITASADTAKVATTPAVMIDNTVTYDISKKDQYVTKDSKLFFGHGVRYGAQYNGPTEAFFINGIN
ncbi:MAG: hypothetical protein COC17_03810 [Hyphomicrobiales bacterium]|nr:hypothetical protein [Hyphomicrobiales bacterium]PCH50709.1 MAG: hypothetical protein COC17_03810 [Hyphomicrobiales bacterium]